MKNHKYYLLGIVFVAIILLLPMFLNPYHENDDTIFHVANVLAIEKSLDTGGFSPIAPLVARNFGYASSMLYPPLSHNVTAMIYHVVKSFLSVASVFKIVHFIVILASGITMYFLAFKFSKKRSIAFLSSILYMTFPYQLADTYIRCAFAESCIFIFMPLILSGLISLLDGEPKKFYLLFIIGYVGGILSHFTIMIYATIFFAIFLLIYHKKVFKKEFLKPFIIASLFVLGISLFYLEPMIEYKIRGGISVFQTSLMTDGVHTRTLSLLRFLPYSWEYILFHFSLVSLLLFIVTIAKRKKITFPNYTKGMLIVFTLFLFMITPFFPWKLLPDMFQMLQFPWRLCSFTGLIFALVAPLCWQVVNKKKWFVLITIAIVGLSFFDIHFRDEGLFLYSNEEIVSLGGAMGQQSEYLSLNAHDHQDYFHTRDSEIHVKENQGNVKIIKNEVPVLSFEIQDIKSEVTLELPRLYYIGYGLFNEQNEQIEVYENDMGFIETKISTNGHYTLKYIGTRGMNIANIISWLSIIGSCIGWWYLSYQDKKKLES